MFLITSPHLTSTVCGYNSLCAYTVENVCAKKLNAVLDVMGLFHLHAQTMIWKRTWIFKFGLCCNSGTQGLSMQLIMILLRCLGKQRGLCCWGLGPLQHPLSTPWQLGSSVTVLHWQPALYPQRGAFGLHPQREGIPALSAFRSDLTCSAKAQESGLLSVR